MRIINFVVVLGKDAGGEFKMDVNCEASSERDDHADIRLAKRKCLFAILAACALWGFLRGLLLEDSTFMMMVDLFAGVFILVLALAWCLIDSKLWNFTISRKLSVFIFALLAVGLPFYIFMTRRGWGCLTTLVLAVLFVILDYAVFCAAYGLGSAIFNMIYA